MTKLLYKVVTIVVSVLSGMLAGAIFKRVWKAAAGEEEAPTATDIRRGWHEVLTAAALQGAIFALVRAAVERATAESTRKLTGVWPGDDSQSEKEEEA
jgi:TRAP-type C4-dicarboxylate transport system permease small subunit